MNDKPTREQVAAEPAGRRLDGWVAEFVTGWGPSAIARDMNGVPFPEDVPHYSTDPGDAWAVVGHLARRWDVVLHACPRGHSCQLSDVPRLGLIDYRPREDAPAMPLAVCRAALLAALTPAEYR